MLAAISGTLSTLGQPGPNGSHFLIPKCYEKCSLIVDLIAVTQATLVEAAQFSLATMGGRGPLGIYNGPRV